MADLDSSAPLLTQRKVISGIHEAQYPDSHQKPQEQPEDDSKTKPRKRESPYSITNFLWILAAIAVLYYTNMAMEIFTNKKVVRWWFNIACLSIGVNIGICMFLILYVSYYRKISSDLWEELYPIAIPVATGAFLFGSFCMNVALWPIWSFLTPVFLFVLLMAVVVIIAMLPAF